MTATYGTIQTPDVPMSSLLPQATPNVAGTTEGSAYMAHYGALRNDAVQLQAPPTTACTATTATITAMVCLVGIAGNLVCR